MCKLEKCCYIEIREFKCGTKISYHYDKNNILINSYLI